MPVLGNPNKHVRAVCEYIFESEEHDFKEQIENSENLTDTEIDLLLDFIENSENLTDTEIDLLLDFIEQGQIKPSREVIEALKKINHVYSRAALAIRINQWARFL